MSQDPRTAAKNPVSREEISNHSEGRVFRISNELSESDLRIIVGHDEVKYQAALKIRAWLRICLRKRRHKKMEAQLVHLQQQYQLMLSNPQHFYEAELVSLMQMCPSYSSPINPEADPYRVMTEVNDSLLRSELRKHAQIVPRIRDTALSEKFKKHLQLIEAGRREILQVYAKRVQLMSNKPVPLQLPKNPTIIVPENAENTTKTSPALIKPTKMKKSSSLRWADSTGQSLVIARSFQTDDIVTSCSPTPGL